MRITAHVQLSGFLAIACLCCAVRCCASTRRWQWQMLRRRLQSVPASAKTAAFTGTYIFIVGLAVIAAPRSCFSLLFDARYPH